MSGWYRLSFPGILLRGGHDHSVVGGHPVARRLLLNLPEFSVTERPAGSGVAIGVVDTQWLLKESKLGRQVNAGQRSTSL